MYNMKHRHQKINGWFNFEDIYKDMVAMHDKGHFVEIGTYLGKSAAFMGVEIFNSNKAIKFDTIDTFKGSPSEINGKHSLFKHTDVYKIAKTNLTGLPVNIVIGDSIEVSKNYENESLDFVFIDGSHLYNDVKNDIKAWKKKIKKGGFIAGHDYDNTNVKKAVTELLGDCPKSITSWMIQC